MDATVDSPHPDVCHAPEDKPKEGIEEGGHQGQQVGEERNDFCNYEGSKPGRSQNTTPGCPSNKSVLGLMSRALEKSKKDEAAGYGGAR
jgi:hypothetical protein